MTSSSIGMGPLVARSARGGGGPMAPKAAMGGGCRKAGGRPPTSAAVRLQKAEVRLHEQTYAKAGGLTCQHTAATFCCVTGRTVSQHK